SRDWSSTCALPISGIAVDLLAMNAAEPIARGREHLLGPGDLVLGLARRGRSRAVEAVARFARRHRRLLFGLGLRAGVDAAGTFWLLGARVDLGVGRRGLGLGAFIDVDRLRRRRFGFGTGVGGQLGLGAFVDRLDL